MNPCTPPSANASASRSACAVTCGTVSACRADPGSGGKCNMPTNGGDDDGDDVRRMRSMAVILTARVARGEGGFGTRRRTIRDALPLRFLTKPSRFTFRAAARTLSRPMTAVRLEHIYKRFDQT